MCLSNNQLNTDGCFWAEPWLCGSQPVQLCPRISHSLPGISWDTTLPGRVSGAWPRLVLCLRISLAHQGCPQLFSPGWAQPGQLSSAWVGGPQLSFHLSVWERWMGTPLPILPSCVSVWEGSHTLHVCLSACEEMLSTALSICLSVTTGLALPCL